MTADCRLVLVRGRGSEMLESCKLALAGSLEGAFIIVEASDTTTRHAIVKLFEGADHAAAIGCYPDEPRDIGALLGEVLAADGVTISDEARTAVIQRLGGNRAASRREIEKLALLAGPGGTLDFEDVVTALGDGAGLAISDIAAAAADGTCRASRTHHREGLGGQAARRCRAARMPVPFSAASVRSAGDAARRVGAAGGEIASPAGPFPAAGQDHFAASALERTGAVGCSRQAPGCRADGEDGPVNDQALCAQTLLGVCLRARTARR